MIHSVIHVSHTTSINALSVYVPSFSSVQEATNWYSPHTQPQGSGRVKPFARSGQPPSLTKAAPTPLPARDMIRSEWDHLIVLGDFNGAPTPDSRDGQTSTSDRALQAWLSKHPELTDLIGATHGPRTYTFQSSDPESGVRIPTSRIDHIFVHDTLIPSVSRAFVVRNVRGVSTDHFMIGAHFPGLSRNAPRRPPPNHQPRPKAFKPVSKAERDKITARLATFDIHGDSPTQRLEALLHLSLAEQARITGFTAIPPQVNHLLSSNHLSWAIDEAISAIDDGHFEKVPNRVKTVARLALETGFRLPRLNSGTWSEVRSTLDTARSKWAEIALRRRFRTIRDRVDESFVDGTGLFYKKVSKDHAKPASRVIDTMLLGKTVTTDPAVITKAMLDHMSSVTAQPERALGYRRAMNDSERKQTGAPNPDAGLLRPVTLPELQDKLKWMGNKATGDSHSFAFWRCWPEHWQGALLSGINAILTSRSLPPVYKQSKVLLIPKEDGIPQLDKLRPITLTSSVWRVLFSILTDRMYLWLSNKPSALFAHQYGFLRGRSTLHAASVLQSIIETTWDSEDDVTYALFLDVAKAFDSISWTQIASSLHDLGIDGDFIQFVLTSYHGNSVQVIGPDGLSAPFCPERGVKQGCPLSPLLFVLAINPVLTKLQAAGGRKQAWMESIQSWTLAFADDLALVTRGPLTKAPQARKLLKQLAHTTCIEYERIGIRIKREKTKAMRIVPRSKPATPCNIAVFKTRKKVTRIRTSRSVRYLGFWFGANPASSHQAINNHVRRVAKYWTRQLQRQPLTLNQRIRFVNAVVLPKMAYPLTIACSSMDHMDKWTEPLISMIKRGNRVPPSLTTVTGAAYLALSGMTSLTERVMTSRTSWLLTALNPQPTAPYEELLKLHRVSQAREMVRLPEPRGPAWMRETLSFLAAHGIQLQETPLQTLPPSRSPNTKPVPGGLKLYTDGSLESGTGGVGIHCPQLGLNISYNVPNATSSTEMELMAIAAAWTLLDPEQAPAPPHTIITVSDSMSARDAIQAWRASIPTAY